VAFLFDTDAVSELLRPQPARTYLNWLVNVARKEQFTSAVVIGELYKGAYRSQACDRHLNNIEKRIIPAITILPFDIGTAKVFGKIRAHLEEAGTILPDADLQIAATALEHDLELVTENMRHFKRVPQLKLNSILFDSRQEWIFGGPGTGRPAGRPYDLF
jgi:predicted nucleic acid-binding protein